MLVSMNNIKQEKLSFSRHISIEKSVQFTDKAALKLLEDELCIGMPKEDIVDWMKKVKHTCKKFGIAPKRLPINSEHPGNLTGVERSNIFSEIFYSIFNDVNNTKISLFC
jgi:hypothetical protein